MTGESPTPEDVSSLVEDRNLVVVSNREPYSHEYDDDGEVSVSCPAGGLTSALDPVMQSVGGTWVAWASGDADDVTSDEAGRVGVPPESPAYTLRRVPLSDERVDGYYYGYSNQVLWPVCHLDTAKVNAKGEFWEHYQAANRSFADAVSAEAGDDPIVWFQDYHLALAPELVREQRPDAFCMQFWHVPWPPRDAFQAAPQYEQLLEGLLGNDLLGVHTDRYCRNFLDCAAALSGATVDRATRSVVYDGHRTFVRPFPLGVDADHRRDLARSAAAAEFWRSFRDSHGLDGTRVALGVERLDYTKGIPERLAALERLWETRPEWRGELTYVQKASESRTRIPAYQRLQDEVRGEVARVNDRFGTDDWRPIVYVEDHLPQEGLAALYREADLCLVSALRDGMNLVAKEYVASQVDDPGVLLLSELAGASEKLGDEVLTIHPRDTDGVADAIERGLQLPADERERRMGELKRQVHADDVYAWLAAQFRTVKAIQRGRERAAAPPRGR
ncbi:alpha,alpha-trehalose-phosphate synthase (UDP-forming) [Halomicrococcus gelatinilyticus]|uniref:alpha,alpha-trehalose-phosphate synthase (UDP-forming) n=1 Tax=Halomicrococcus gelatinilyticus TaxID=1702103 RepID=UPI002E0DFE9E